MLVLGVGLCDLYVGVLVVLKDGWIWVVGSYGNL